MMNRWIRLALVAIITSVVFGDSSERGDHWYDDYYLGDVDKLTSPFDNKNDDNLSPEINEYNDEKKFENELEEYVVENKTDDNDDGSFDDYQFEDNRSNVDNTYSDDRGYDLIQPLVGELKDENIERSTELPADSTKTNEETDENIIDETKSILREDTANDFAVNKTFEENVEDDDNSDIFEETSKILEESYDSMEDEKDNKNSGEEMNVAESDEDLKRLLSTTVEGRKSEEERVDKAYNDLNRFHRTWKKLKEMDDGNKEDDYIGSDEKNEEIGSDDYEEIGDAELEKIFENNSKSVEEDVELSDGTSFAETSSTTGKTYKPLPYMNDALVAGGTEQHSPTSTVGAAEEPNTTDTYKTTEEPASQTLEGETTRQPDSEEMTSAEVDTAMKEFTARHRSVLDVKSGDVTNAINIWLTVDNAVEVSSPDYPLPYPTNNTVDWTFSGDGMGIELNITDFSINGHLGDYLLVKPGGADASGSTGLIFSYALRSERRYRFLDVDRMFVRFVANPGNQFMRGFKFSARMVVPRPDAIPEPEPEPEPAIPDPPATMTVNLGGVTLVRFVQIEEQFRHIIADMASLYINANGIDPGLNGTRESTRIASRALCFHKWPQFEMCVEVQFGVGLVYDAREREPRLHRRDLADMWTTYSQRDPFRARMRALGITDYQVPDDSGVLSLWLVVAAGVLVSAALLALALWRFSCFEDYTRMPAYGDTDSLAENRTSDLYPTPHQTLPPLFETDYKWAHEDRGDTVDAGFVDASYVHDTRAARHAARHAARDRHFSFTPRDVYDA